jgi:hypothetical protein
MPKILAVCAVLLSSCVSMPTAQKYAAAVGKQKGKTSAELVRGWGVPSSTMALSDGSTAYQYVWRNGSSGEVTRHYSSVEVDSTSFWCKTTFFIGKDDKVASARWEGNACNSY